MKKKYLIVVADYYKDIADGLISSALKIIPKKNIIKIIKVPGAFEIPITISKNLKKYDGFLALGCVIKGQTPHFDFISQASTNAIMELSVLNKKPIGNGIITCLNKKQALERLLFVLYLHNQEELSDEGVRSEINSFIKTGKVDDILYDPDSDFNWRTLQRLISHAKAWQPSAFNLLDRLQIDLLSGKPEISRAKWRMDVALDEVCIGGTTNLFIVLNNQTFEKDSVSVEVLVPNGEPESRTHRFELEACPPPRVALKLSDSNEEDALDWVPRYLHKGVVLWINVAWERSFFGIANIQVVLRDNGGVVLESKVLTIDVSRKSTDILRKRMLRLETARKVGEMKIPQSN